MRSDVRVSNDEGDHEHLRDALGLRFPRDGDARVGCEWVEVVAQGVPAHVGTPTPGYRGASRQRSGRR